ncbi:hypothetical protein PTSG_08946 [Salpingoeca rosetta]|uniref:Uncharacterized protein n=1 Tax=Salpingoeca rosetta (strain ATCC 50818 / BSB-021) TaxID=946362 RepID=F2ULR8_SALR5|nr:uncharacterized protein PTSG_08946 [Salpingoeca rosetta]EGD78067.1 hypothetical protein PTSG_08946 [Salpingoeca rosetta]|eukprot:XP_004989743.1 hypothetical protein PTSG_08946 [Salpingoeca rosetta]
MSAESIEEQLLLSIRREEQRRAEVEADVADLTEICGDMEKELELLEAQHSQLLAAAGRLQTYEQQHHTQLSMLQAHHGRCVCMLCTMCVGGLGVYWALTTSPATNIEHIQAILAFPVLELPFVVSAVNSLCQQKQELQAQVLRQRGDIVTTLKGFIESLGGVDATVKENTKGADEPVPKDSIPGLFGSLSALLRAPTPSQPFSVASFGHHNDMGADFSFAFDDTPSQPALQQHQQHHQQQQQQQGDHRQGQGHGTLFMSSSSSDGTGGGEFDPFAASSEFGDASDGADDAPLF